MDGTRVLAADGAPGKVILLGEHAVVYGHPALAVPVDAVGARARIVATGLPARLVGLETGARGVTRAAALASLPADDVAAAVVRAALAHRGRSADDAPWDIELTSDVPIGRGMGSSAAVSVALARAVCAACGAVATADEAIALAMAGERVAHGRPSGIDPAVVAHGRPIRFVAGAARPLAVGRALTLVVADSGAAGATRAMVAAVSSRRARDPEATDAALAEIGALVDAGAAALAEGALERLGRAMDDDHRLLAALGVSTPRLDALVAAARRAGALGAKLSGSGGGGVVVALTEPGAAREVAGALGGAGAGAVWTAAVPSTPA